MTINLATGTASDGDTLANIENVIGTNLDDIILGDDAVNSLYGSAGMTRFSASAARTGFFGEAGDDDTAWCFGNDSVDAVQATMAYLAMKATIHFTVVMAVTSSQAATTTMCCGAMPATIISMPGQATTVSI